MVQRVATIAFEGVDVPAVDVEVQVAPGLPASTRRSHLSARGYHRVLRVARPLAEEVRRAA